MSLDPTSSEFEKLITGLKSLVLEECNVSGVSPSDISNEDQIINGTGALKLDSLDAVEIVAAIEREFGIKFESANSSRALFKNFNAMAEYLVKNATSDAISRFLNR